MQKALKGRWTAHGVVTQHLLHQIEAQFVGRWYYLRPLFLLTIGKAKPYFLSQFISIGPLLFIWSTQYHADFENLIIF